MTDKVGFVGLGNMGGPMARNLLRAGVRLVVHDLDPSKVRAMAESPVSPRPPGPATS